MKKRFGFIHDKLDIKILVLFILRCLSEPVTIDELTELAMCDDGVSYFDLMECIAELVKTGHLTFKGGEYSLTEKGVRNGEITEDSLPFSIKMHIESATFAHRSKKIRDAMISTSHSHCPDGSYTVELSLSDGVGDIVSIRLYVVGRKHALTMEKGFRKNAEKVYNMLINLILD